LEFRQLLLDCIGDQLLGFATSRSVADSDQRNVVLLDEASEFSSVFGPPSLVADDEEFIGMEDGALLVEH
jgi:hypothetical protein